VGFCRTYVFARDASQDAVLEAIREKRTVVFGPEGRAYGDPALIDLALHDGRVPVPNPHDGWLTVLSRVFGLIGLIGLSLLGESARPH